MFGWINDCTECLVVSKFGEATWHAIKAKAGCDVADGGFLRYKYYSDADTVQLVVAASQVLQISVDDVLQAFGDYFIDYVQDNGYSNVLECLGSNMRDWLSNLNTLHDHLQASYPKGFVAPVFWSEDDSESEGAILVHYYSQRGTLLVPLVVGILKRVSRSYFEIEIELDQLALQDEAIEGTNGQTHKQTVWRVRTTNPEDAYKLRGKKKRSSTANRTKSSTGDDPTATTVMSTTFSQQQHNYQETFKEGGVQASILRVEELVRRSFFKEGCELYHALTLQHYTHLVDVWKTANFQTIGLISTNINGYVGELCYEVFTLQEDDLSTWPTLKDLPSRLHAETMDCFEFGGKAVETGAYPPSINRELQSYPPLIRAVTMMNSPCLQEGSNTPKSIDLSFSPMVDDMSLTLEQQISPQLKEAGLTDWDDETSTKLASGELETRWIICSSIMDPTPYHTFTQGDLANTSLQQLFDLVSGAKLDPVCLLIQVEEAERLEDDEEDI